MPGALAERVALVTGGGRGIGRSIALTLARAGVHVAVAARTVQEIEAVAAEIAALGRRTMFLPLDVSDRSQLSHVPEQVTRALGPIEILVNNAGIHASGPVTRLDDATWDAVLATDLTGPFLLCRACLPAMIEARWGRIINVASIAGKIGLKYGAAYSAAKHGLIGLTRSLAAEGARHGITANAICPSWTETQMMDEAVATFAHATSRSLADARKVLVSTNPLGRAATPEEVADAAVFLAQSAVITGQAVNVDGGEVMA
jgi:meso-butanediol dehydrogenase / (S,S)-butanediol dehydrogenase / diacetyl reductase